MRLDGSPELSLVVADPRRVADLRADDIPVLLGALEDAARWIVRVATGLARKTHRGYADALDRRILPVFGSL